MTASRVGLLVWLWLVTPNTGANDVIREEAIAQSLVQQLPGTAITWLTTEGQRFLALQNPVQTPSSRGSVILLHDLDGHPNLEPVIAELRTRLPQHGWQTLSLQMPLLETGATLADYLPLLPAAKNRIAAAVTFLKQQNQSPIVVVGYGLGALMAITAVLELGEDIKALVALSLPVTGQQPPVDPLAVLKTAQLPILDLYAEADWPEVTVSAPVRRLAAKHNPNYRQIKLDAVNHTYEHQSSLLVKRIYSWLNQVTENSSHALPAGTP
ncbi:MAG: phospholipase [Methylobacter sp.]|nr:MAG: phospholipase [Methylobacter sp.]